MNFIENIFFNLFQTGIIALGIWNKHEEKNVPRTFFKLCCEEKLHVPCQQQNTSNYQKWLLIVHQFVT